MSAPNLRKAAENVLRAVDTYRDAVNGEGHGDEDHDRYLHMDPCTSLRGVQHVYDPVGDCSACGGAQYGTDAELQHAYGALRVAVGQKPKPWEAS